MAETSASKSRFQITIRDYLMVLFRRKMFFLIPLCIVFFSVTFISFFLPKIYQAKAVVMVDEPEVLNPLVRTGTQRSPAPPPIMEELLIFRGQLLTWPNIVRLIRRLGMGEQVTSEAHMQEMIGDIDKNFEVGVVARNIYEVSFYDKNPLKAQSAVNLMLQIFIESNLERERDDAIVAVDFIGEQMKKYEDKLTESDNELFKFKEENTMSFPGLKENVNVQRLVRYEGELYAVDLELNQKKRELELLEKQMKGEEKVLLTEAMRSVNPVVDNLFNQLSTMETELVMLLSDATDEHPRVIELRGLIDKTRDQLNRAMQQTVTAGEDTESNPVFQRLEQKYREMKLEVEKLEAGKAEVEAIVQEYRKRVNEAPEIERDLTRLFRENRVNETIYSMLKERWESSRISQVEVKERGNRYRILAPARLPLTPAKPKKLLISLAALAIGIILGSGSVFVAEISDHSLHGMEDAKAVLGQPLLAAVPVITTRTEAALRQAKRRFFLTVTVTFTVCVIIGVIAGLIKSYS